jgi:hypothetical protein
MTSRRSEAEDRLDARTRRTTTQESTVDAPVRTIHLCAATTKRPTTLLAAIDRSIAELTKSGHVRRPVTLPDRVRPYGLTA